MSSPTAMPDKGLPKHDLKLPVVTRFILIPAAKAVPIELQAEFGPISPAMIPISARPAMHYIAEKYENAPLLVAVHDGAGDVRQYAERFLSERDVHVIDVGDTSSLGETVFRLLVGITESSQLVINFADTSVVGDVESGDVIYYAWRKDLYRWTVFSIDNLGRLQCLQDKNVAKGEESLQRVFVGVFVISDSALFQRMLARSLETRTQGLDPLYDALKLYYNSLPPNTVNYFDASEVWLDWGHIDTYYENRLRLNSLCRHFNEVRVDPRRGIISKRSQQKEKLVREIQWYLKLPTQLQYVAPRVFDYSLAYENTHVDLEFYGYPVLNDLYLFGRLDLGAWARIADAVVSVLEDFQKFRFLPASSSVLVESMRFMYEVKTTNRIRQYCDEERFSPFRSGRLRMDGRRLWSLDEMIETLPEILRKVGVYNDPAFNIIHGDLCFSNILYDHRNCILRAIDPRGSFGQFDIYGDRRYDLCKLSHSIEGDYDFLVNGLFEMRHVGNELELRPYADARHREIKAVFRKTLGPCDSEERMRIRLLESLLFLSMPPLHADRPRSQEAFVARGLGTFSQIAEEVM